MNKTRGITDFFIDAYFFLIECHDDSQKEISVYTIEMDTRKMFHLFATESQVSALHLLMKTGKNLLFQLEEVKMLYKEHPEVYETIRSVILNDQRN